MSNITTFEPVTLTEKGLLLQSKMQTGEKLKIVRVAIGDGFLPEGQDKKKLLQLVHEIATHTSDTEGTSTIADIVYNELNDAGSVITRIKIQNGDSEFFLREIGIIAFDPDEGEILYAYTTCGNGAECIPAYNGINRVVRDFSLYTKVEQAIAFDVKVTLPARSAKRILMLIQVIKLFIGRFLLVMSSQRGTILYGLHHTHHRKMTMKLYYSLPITTVTKIKCTLI